MLIIFICIGLLILLLIEIKFKIEFKNSNFKFTIILLKIIKINIKPKNEKKVKRKAKEKMDIKGIFNVLYGSINNVKYLLSNLKLNVKVDCIFSAFSVHETAILYGVINSIIYFVAALISKEFKEYTGDFILKPDFKNKNCNIEIELNVLLGIRNIHIIIFILKMFPRILLYLIILRKKRSELHESSNRRPDENYDG